MSVSDSDLSEIDSVPDPFDTPPQAGPSAAEVTLRDDSALSAESSASEPSGPRFRIKYAGDLRLKAKSIFGEPKKPAKKREIDTLALLNDDAAHGRLSVADPLCKLPPPPSKSIRGNHVTFYEGANVVNAPRYVWGTSHPSRKDTHPSLLRILDKELKEGLEADTAVNRFARKYWTGLPLDLNLPVAGKIPGEDYVPETETAGRASRSKSGTRQAAQPAQASTRSNKTNPFAAANNGINIDQNLKAPPPTQRSTRSATAAANGGLTTSTSLPQKRKASDTAETENQEPVAKKRQSVPLDVPGASAVQETVPEESKTITTEGNKTSQPFECGPKQKAPSPADNTIAAARELKTMTKKRKPVSAVDTAISQTQEQEPIPKQNKVTSNGNVEAAAQGTEIISKKRKAITVGDNAGSKLQGPEHISKKRKIASSRPTATPGNGHHGNVQKASAVANDARKATPSSEGNANTKRKATSQSLINDQEDNFTTKPSIKLNIPDHVNALLVDDWENVTKNLQLVPLPAKKPVALILEDYLQDERPKRQAGTSNAEVLDEAITGLRTYFDRCLGRILLYRFERNQYADMYKMWHAAQGELAGKTASETYGAEHLARLLVTLPELIAQTNMDQQSVNRLRIELTTFTNWLGRNARNYFVSEYETPSPEYIEKARSVY